MDTGKAWEIWGKYRKLKETLKNIGGVTAIYAKILHPSNCNIFALALRASAKNIAVGGAGAIFLRK